MPPSLFFYFGAFDPRSDDYWRGHLESPSAGVYVNAAKRYDLSTGGVLETVSYAGFGDAYTLARNVDYVHKAAGVFIVLGGKTGSSQYRFLTVRDADGLAISDDGPLGDWFPTSKETYHLYGPMCWSDGELWGVKQIKNNTTPVEIWHWHPGMAAWKHAATFPMIGSASDGSGICMAAEAGRVWVQTGTTIRHVDTGLRPWLRLTQERGALANGADATTDLAINAAGVPEGVYHAEVAFTQAPYALQPGILVRVTLTVAADGTRTISIGPQFPAAVWDIDPAAPSERQVGSQTVFEGLNKAASHKLQAVPAAND